MTGTGWPGGGACLPAVMMALRDINARQGLLDGYNLTYTWVDTQCKAGLATFQMLEALKTPPTKIMLLGCGCSTAAEATAQVSYLYNLTQLAYGASSPTLSDRKRFPNFFRVSGPDQKLNPAKIAMMEKFNWKKVATINQALEFFSLVIDDFVNSVKGTDIRIITQEIFQHDPSTRVENLKNRDARIIVTACYEDKARLLLCAAYKLGLYGPKIVWMFVAWYSSDFWLRDLDDVPCSAEEMSKAADGAFVIGFYYRNPVAERGIAGITAAEFDVMYKEEATYDPIHHNYEFVAAKCYDHVWVGALALNCTETYLKNIGHPKTIADFTYEDSFINDIIVSCMSNVSIIGVVGSISFEGGGDPINDVKIERIQGGKRTGVGTYVMNYDPKHFVWIGDGIQWQDGNIPRDSTYVISEEVIIPLPLYVVMSACATLGMLAAVGFFAFNIVHRNNSIVKLSSPNINNVLLLGCILTYSTVFMKTNESQNSSLCKVRLFCFCTGFTIAFGALFSKTWRVYKIFTNKKLLKLTIKDYQLIGMVCALCGFIIVILIVWEILGPHVYVTKELTKEVYVIGNDAEIHPYVRVCYSDYDLYFSWAIYITEGALLSFGAFLAWETRHVKIEALNDSRQIGMCVYNVFVLSAVGLTFSLLLEEKVVEMYGIISACVIIGTTLTQAIVFVPKVLAVYGFYTASIHPMDSSIGSRNLPSQLTAKQMSTNAGQSMTVSSQA